MRRGEVYYAVVPYLPEAPLRCFIEDKDKKGCGLGRGKIRDVLPKDFRGILVNPEYHVVLPLKRRMVVVVSPVSRLKGVPAALTMPIFKVSPENEVKPFFQDLMTENKIREAYYLGERHGLKFKSYVAVTDVKLIHQSLIGEKAKLELTSNDIDQLDVRLAECMDSSFVLACQECDRKCDICVLRKVVNQLRR